MLVNFSVQNFRSIKNEVCLSFEATKSTELEDYYIIPTKDKNLRLLKLGLLYGANASGKTTVLVALDFLRELVVDPFVTKNASFDFQPFLFDEKSKKENSHFTIDFIQNDIRYLYHLAFNQSHIASERLEVVGRKNTLVFERKTDAEKQLSTIKFGSGVKIRKAHLASLEANTLWNNTVLGGYLKTNFESVHLQNVMQWFEETLHPIITTHTSLYEAISRELDEQSINKKDIVSMLQKADFNISDIIIENDEIDVTDEMIKLLREQEAIPSSKIDELEESRKIEMKRLLFEHRVAGSAYTLPYGEESHGTRRYYGISGLLSLMMSQSIVVSIDEIESALHPDLMRHFILSFISSSNSSQIVATTHMRELLMEKDMFRSDVIWFTQRDDQACTDLFSLADFKTDVFRKDTGSVFNAYKSGKLGAVPFFGDYYTELTNGKSVSP